jgi:hypothetical protein
MMASPIVFASYSAECIHAHQFEVSIMARVLQVSQSGFYAWLKRPISSRDEENAVLLEQITVYINHLEGLTAVLESQLPCTAQERLRKVVYESLSPQPDWPAIMGVFKPPTTPSGSISGAA